MKRKSRKDLFILFLVCTILCVVVPYVLLYKLEIDEVQRADLEEIKLVAKLVRKETRSSYRRQRKEVVVYDIQNEDFSVVVDRKFLGPDPYSFKSGDIIWVLLEKGFYEKARRSKRIRIIQGYGLRTKEGTEFTFLDYKNDKKRGAAFVVWLGVFITLMTTIGVALKYRKELF